MFKRRVNNDDRFFFTPALFSANFPCLQKEITGI